MNSHKEKMIIALSPEIEKKCCELKEKRKEKLYSKIFFFLCIFAISIPILFVWFDFNLSILIIPAVFIFFSFLIIFPILIKQQGDNNYVNN